MSQSKSLAINCSDRGQHGWISLGDVAVDERGYLQPNRGYTHGEIASRRKNDCVWVEWSEEPEGVTSIAAVPLGWLHLRCPRCGPRNEVVWSHAVALRKIDAILQHSERLDISALP